MIVTIPYNFIEEHAECMKEADQYLPYAYNAQYEFSVDECEFDDDDLKDITSNYFDDIINIILNDDRLRKALFKKFVEIATNDKPSGE